MNSVLVDVIASELAIDGHKAHHLLNVLRVQIGEEILLLDGQGRTATAMVENCAKKQIFLKLKNQPELFVPNYDFELAIAITKKENWERALTHATELGFQKIHPLLTERSQKDLPSSRLQRIIEAAIEQSLNPWLPQITEPQNLQNFDLSPYENIVLFHTDPSCASFEELKITTGKQLLVIGPEGGLTVNEVAWLQSQKFCHTISLPSPVLRTSTAVATAGGYLLAQLSKIDKRC